MFEDRIRRRTKRILTRKPDRFGFTFGEDGSLALSDLITIPMFKHRDLTVESLQAALEADTENTFTVADGRVRLTTPPAE